MEKRISSLQLAKCIRSITLLITSDSLEIDFKNAILKFFPDQKLTPNSANIYSLFRILDSIDAQCQTIYSIPLEISDKKVQEFGIENERGRNVFRTIAGATELQYQVEGESSDDEVNPSPKKTTTPAPNAGQTVQSNMQNAKDIKLIVDRVEDVKNYFKEFYEKFKISIFQREFWALFLNDILSELKSGKSDDMLLIEFLKPEYFEDGEAAEYLVLHRK